MKKILFFVFLVMSTHVAGALTSSFPSTVPGINIPNTHQIYESQFGQRVFRGMEPRSEKQIQELISIGVEAVLIFKTETKGEVEKEKTWLFKSGFDSDSIHHIPFPWKDLNNFKESCSMTVKALKIIEQSLEQRKSLFFHCTMGEDRTGYLAGLWGHWIGTYSRLPDSFQNELCAYGYEAGNPRKPHNGVVLKIRQTLTPMYVKMAILLIEARARGQRLVSSLCDLEPIVSQESISEYRCSSLK